MSPLLLSVVMPVYNGAPYLGRAIDSILCQTCGDYEFIIINDGSIDESAAIIQKYDDSRIRYYEHPNRGLAATLNRGIEMATGKYLARQDQDDISFPQRFEKQIAFTKHVLNMEWSGPGQKFGFGTRRQDEPTSILPII